MTYYCVFYVDAFSVQAVSVADVNGRSLEVRMEVYHTNGVVLRVVLYAPLYVLDVTDLDLYLSTN